jgi:hypothetical protein
MRTLENHHHHPSSTPFTDPRDARRVAPAGLLPKGKSRANRCRGPMPSSLPPPPWPSPPPSLLASSSLWSRARREKGAAQARGRQPFVSAPGLRSRGRSRETESGHGDGDADASPSADGGGDGHGGGGRVRGNGGPAVTPPCLMDVNYFCRRATTATTTRRQVDDPVRRPRRDLLLRWGFGSHLLLSGLRCGGRYARGRCAAFAV